jgi:hypothetical protein
LQCFANVLRSIHAKGMGYTLKGATYSPENADIFIETDDELWDMRFSIDEQ